MSSESAEESPNKQGVPPLRVLCVDDNHDVADSAADLLQIVGFDAKACYDGASALSEAAVFLPSLCLIDLNMPQMNGDELAVKLRFQANDPIVLVAITAMSDEQSQQRIRDAGFDLHLVKPVDPCNLIEIVDRLYHVWSVALSQKKSTTA